MIFFESYISDMDENPIGLIYTMTLENGTKIENLRANGTYLVSNDPIDENIFDGNLGEVTITNQIENMHFENLLLVKPIIKRNDGYYFGFKEISKSELEQAKLRSDIDYLSMMSNIDI